MRIAAYAVDMRNLCSFAELLPCQRLVFFIDGNQQIAVPGHEFFYGVVHKPGRPGRALEEVKPVGHVDDLRPVFSGFPCRQPGDDPAHGGVAQNHVIALLRQQLLELPIRAQIVRALR